MADVGTILAVAGTALGAVGALQQGKAQATAHKFQQAQYERQAQEARSIATQRAAERRRQQRLLESNQLARAASVGGAADPSVESIIAQTAATGERNVQTELALGENRAQGYDLAAEAEVSSAKSAKSAGVIEAFSTLVSGGSSLFSTFGERDRPAMSSYFYG